MNQLNKLLSYIDKGQSDKFPFIYLFICYWVNTYYDLGHVIIKLLQLEDSLFEWATVIFFIFSINFLNKKFPKS